jgi:hypothetical protein
VLLANLWPEFVVNGLTSKKMSHIRCDESITLSVALLLFVIK